MAIDKIFNKITPQKICTKVSCTLGRASSVLGEKYEKSNFMDIFEHYFEPKGANNNFPVIAGLMIFLGLVPRIVIASKRNPENKEATKDEVREILFRDIQTVGILLFLLKTLNALIAAAATKKTGLPMTNKPFEKMFDGANKTVGEKLKAAGKNIVSAINPMGGVRAKTNREHISDYSQYSFKSLSNFFNKIEAQRGDKTKVFNVITDGMINEYDLFINGSAEKYRKYGLSDFIKKGRNASGDAPINIAEAQKNAKTTLDKLKNIKSLGLEALINSEDKAIQGAVDDYFASKNNTLLNKAVGLNAWLRAGALAMEAGYLGFGLPALNQRFLEKKYLSSTPSYDRYIPDDKSSAYLIGKNIKATQVKLYHNFIK